MLTLSFLFFRFRLGAGGLPVAPVASSNCTACSTGAGVGFCRLGIGALDIRIAAGSSVLTCQTRIVSVRSGGSTRSRVWLLVETPFHLRFRLLGVATLLAGRFDMERKAEKRVPKLRQCHALGVFFKHKSNGCIACKAQRWNKRGECTLGGE